MNPLLSAMTRYVRRAHTDSRTRRTGNVKARRQRLYLEPLEDRTVPTTISIAGASINEIGSPSAFITAGSGGLQSPSWSILGSDGNLYVASNGSRSAVLRYNATTGAFIDTFVAPGSGGLSNPGVTAFGMAFGPDGNLYVVSGGTNQVLEYNGTTGAFLQVFISAGSGGLNVPRAVTFGADGNLYVPSRDNNSVMRYQGPLSSSPGTPLPATGQSGATFVAPSSGGLLKPLYCIFGPDGNLYVDGSQTVGVLRYNGTTGAFIDTFVPGVPGGRGMVFDPEGRLYVGDSSHSIHRYDAQGDFLGDLLVNAVSPTLSEPLGLTFDAQGALLISCNSSNTVVRYDRGVVVSLSAASATPISVNYTTADGSALAGTDYYALSGTVTFAPGQTSREILLATQETASLDGNDNFSVQLSNPTGGATIATGTATVTIVDPTRQFSLGDASAIEGDHTAHYRGAFVQGISGIGFNCVTFGPDGNLYVSGGRGPSGSGLDRYNGTTGAFIDHFVTNGLTPGTRDPLFHGAYLYVAS
jgi:sugar lactone lactonase YvrE